MPYMLVGSRRIDLESTRVELTTSGKGSNSFVECLHVSPQASLNYLLEVSQSMGGPITIYDESYSTTKAATGNLLAGGKPTKIISLTKEWLINAKT